MPIKVFSTFYLINSICKNINKGSYLNIGFWNGFSLIRIRIVGEKIGTSSGSSPTQFLSHTIAPAGGGGSFPGPNIDDEYEIELPASVLGQISISMDGEGLDAIAGTNWTLEFTTA